MSIPMQSIIDTRRHQMFPVLDPSEIERVRRFGKVRTYGAARRWRRSAIAGHGLSVILAGKVESPSMTSWAAARQSSPTAPARSWASSLNSQAGVL